MKLDFFNFSNLQEINSKQETLEELVNEIATIVHDNVGIEYDEVIKTRIKECKTQKGHLFGKETEFEIALDNKGIEKLSNLSLPKVLEPRRKDFLVVKENELNREKVKSFKRKNNL